MPEGRNAVGGNGLDVAGGADVDAVPEPVGGEAVPGARGLADVLGGLKGKHVHVVDPVPVAGELLFLGDG